MIIFSLRRLIEFCGVSTEICFEGSKFQYELLDILEFTSDRKRMSVVVKEGQTGKIILLSKGADEAILPRACAGILYKHEKFFYAIVHLKIEFSLFFFDVLFILRLVCIFNVLRCR